MCWKRHISAGARCHSCSVLSLLLVYLQTSWASWWPCNARGCSLILGLEIKITHAMGQSKATQINIENDKKTLSPFVGNVFHVVPTCS